MKTILFLIVLLLVLDTAFSVLGTASGGKCDYHAACTTKNDGTACTAVGCTWTPGYCCDAAGRCGADAQWAVCWSIPTQADCNRAPPCTDWTPGVLYPCGPYDATYSCSQITIEADCDAMVAHGGCTWTKGSCSGTVPVTYWDPDIKIGSDSVTCINSNSWRTLEKYDTTTSTWVNLTGLTSAWCYDGNTGYKGIIKGTVSDSAALCFTTDCPAIVGNGWTASLPQDKNKALRCPCGDSDQMACITNSACVNFADPGYCYTSHACAPTKGWSYNSTLFQAATSVVDYSYTYACAYAPYCSKAGWLFGYYDVDVTFFDETSKQTTIPCTSLVGDGVNSQGYICNSTSDRYFYDVAEEKCYYGVSCVNCDNRPGTNGYYVYDPANYCGLLGSSYGQGGWVGRVTYCPQPGTVVGSKCYYSRDYVQGESFNPCTPTGCAITYDIMVSDVYVCHPVLGALLKTLNMDPPEQVLQTIPSVLAWGYQDMAIYKSSQYDTVLSCSLIAQELMGRQPLSNLNQGIYEYYNSYYNNERSTIRKSGLSGLYNPSDPFNQSGLIGDIAPIDCACLFPNETLIEGIQWISGSTGNYYLDPYSYEYRRDMCNRLYPYLSNADGDWATDCYWNYTAKLPIDPWEYYAGTTALDEHGNPVISSDNHGARLTEWDSWCQRVFPDGEKPCDFFVNKIYNFLFDLNTLVDVKVNVFNPNRTAPIFLSLFEQGDVITSLEEGYSPDAMTKVDVSESAQFNFDLTDDYSFFGFDEAWLSVFCTDWMGNGHLDLSINGEPTGQQFDCNRDDFWQNINISAYVDKLVAGTNYFELSSVEAPVYIGVNNGGLNNGPDNYSVIADNYFISDKRVVYEVKDYPGQQHFFQEFHELPGYEIQPLVIGVGDAYTYDAFDWFNSDLNSVVDVEYASGWGSQYKRLYFLNGSSDKSVCSVIGDCRNASLIGKSFNDLLCIHDQGNISFYGFPDDKVVFIDGVLWLEGASDAMYVGADGLNGTGVFRITKVPNAFELVVSYLGNSSESLSWPFTIVDWDSNGRSNFIGVSDSSSGSLDLSWWEVTPFGSITQTVLIEDMPEYTELVAGDLSMNEGVELLYRTVSDDNYLWLDGSYSSGKRVDTSSLMSIGLVGDDWRVADNTVYVLDNGELSGYSFFNLAGSYDDLAYRFKITDGDKYAAPDLLFPNIMVKPEQSRFTFDEPGFEFIDVPLGANLVCGTDPVFYFEFFQNEDPNIIHYDWFNITFKVDGLPVQCVSAVDNCSPDTYCSTFNVPFPEDAEYSPNITVKCRLPHCDVGRPNLLLLEACVSAGFFEYDNCFSLSTPQPFASDPRGISVSDVSVSDSSVITGTPVTVSGKLSDAYGFYNSDGVLALKIYKLVGAEYVLSSVITPSSGDSFPMSSFSFNWQSESGTNNYLITPDVGTYYEIPVTPTSHNTFTVTGT